MATIRIRHLAPILAAALLVAACGPADGGQDATAPRDDDTLQVRDVRSRMSPQMAGVAAVYLTIINGTDGADTLTGARVADDVADRVELHETYALDDAAEPPDMGGGAGAPAGHGADDAATDGATPMMGMRAVPSIEVPAGATVTLEPGGLHLMVLELARDLVVGDEFVVTLEFAVAGDVEVVAEVRDQV